VAVAHAGAIHPLVQLLRDEAPSVREEAAAALGNLVFFNDETNSGNQAAIAKAGAVPFLAELLKDPKAQVTAAGALRNLAAQNVANQDSICREALESLVHLVAEGNPKAQMEAAGAIHNLVWPLAPTFDHWGGTITKECLLPTSRIQSDGPSRIKQRCLFESHVASCGHACRRNLE
ncbi:unnamed protein product, partial [Durusdinium trenchii]